MQAKIKTPTVIEQMKKLKGGRKLSQMSKKDKAIYRRLRDSISRLEREENVKATKQLWLVSKDQESGDVIFKSKGLTLFGLTPAEYHKAFGRRPRARKGRK